METSNSTEGKLLRRARVVYKSTFNLSQSIVKGQIRTGREERASQNGLAFNQIQIGIQGIGSADQDTLTRLLATSGTSES